MDYIPTLFTYCQQPEEYKKRKEDRQRRIDRRRQITAAENEKEENQRIVEECEKENQELAEGLLLLQQESFMS